jgi:NhaP-type Na+/H+ or K+/H+ antiporter
MEILNQIVTLPMLFFCLVIWFLVQIQRKVVETLFPKLRNKKIWRGLLLPLGPPGTGALLAALLVKYPFPEMLNDTWISRAIVGVACGIASGYVYKIIKEFWKDKLKKIQTETKIETSSGATITTTKIETIPIKATNDSLAEIPPAIQEAKPEETATSPIK